MTEKEKGRRKVLELVERFNEHLVAYKKSEYGETSTRREFIDPFFKALGWDIDNKNGLPESYKEVIHEDKVKVGGATKAPDYSFRLVGQKKLFFLEAKKPSIKIKDDVDPSYQIKRYGWSAKMNISVLTDFEEFAIYDCTKKPLPTDKSHKSRLKYLTFDQYVKEWDFLWSVFSKEAAENGGFNAFAKNVSNKKGSDTVDKEFLKSLDSWRTILAETINRENQFLDEDELNYVVQQTLDRLIFIRIAEDRSIEPYERLKSAIKQGNYYENLLKIFKEADDIYNSGLFNFKKDALSGKIKIDNKTIKEIINQLYYPECPYEFSVLSVEILGSAYEQFLGKTISINKKGKAIIELKPEVRKAGGVYYTPEYIVEYIVKNTVGSFCKNKSPKEVSELKIVDPACGSGSFLIGAYNYLLKWHKDYYSQHPNKKNPITPDGNLTTAEKKRVLLNNIFGVDIDTNAVEVTKLSLLLKCLEGETQSSIAYQLSMFKERALPTLENNIKSGNSLIDMDYYGDEFDFGEEEKVIKPFSWQKAFPEIFRKGGFDVVIGNPPYVFTRDVDWSDEVKNYFWTKFEISKSNDNSRKNQSGKINLYVLFIIKSTELLKEEGLLSFIIPNGLLRTTTYDTTRKFILERTTIERIVDLKDGVFEGVTASTIIINLLNQKTKSQTTIIDANCKLDGFINESNLSKLSQSTFLKNVSHTFSLFINPEEQKIINKISNSNTFLRDIVKDIIEGIVAHKEFITTKQLTKQHKPMLEGKDIKKYQINFGGNYILFDRKKIHRARPDYLWDAPKKLVIQRISGGKYPLVSCVDTSKYLSFASTNLLLLNDDKKSIYTYELISALINSKLWNFYYNKNFSNGSNLTVNISKTFLEMLPLPKKLDPKISKNIEKSVSEIMDLKVAIHGLSLQSKIDQMSQKIEYIEDKINQYVFDLYDLSKEEREIILS